jgi:hypothetical protein
MMGRYREPRAVIRSGQRKRVTHVRDRWRLDTRWWLEQPVSRMYWDLELEGGEVLTLFRDQVSDAWYRQRHV